MSFAGWVVVIAVNGEDRNSDVDIRVFVVDVVERSIDVSTSSRNAVLIQISSPSKLLACVAQHLDLAGLVTEAVHPQTTHDLVHRFARWFVFVEKVTCQENHVDIAFPRQAHDFVECLPAVIAADRVAFSVSDMIIRCDENANRVRCCHFVSWKSCSCGNERRVLTIDGCHDVQSVDRWSMFKKGRIAKAAWQRTDALVFLVKHLDAR
jgi:hypothetical protein